MSVRVSTYFKLFSIYPVQVVHQLWCQTYQRDSLDSSQFTGQKETSNFYEVKQIDATCIHIQK